MNEPRNARKAAALRRALALIIALLVLTAGALPVFAEGEEPAQAQRLHLEINGAYTPVKSNYLGENVNPLTDSSFRTEAVVHGSITLSAPAAVSTLYIVFADTPATFYVKSGDKRVDVAANYLELPVDVSALNSRELTLFFPDKVNVCDVYAFAAGELPAWVQRWDPPCEKADLLLISTHADDEQLFFAGVLPYYTSRGDCEVQVAYFTDHTNRPHRRHELLKGLWAVGVRHYPVIGDIPDAYSETEAQAVKNLKAAGMSREDALLQQIRVIRRFKPQVVVSHDPKGEYGHGQHMLCAATLLEAAPLAADAESDPVSVSQYGAWDVPKIYLHSYEENPIVMNWDEPLEAFGGKTAFQVSQEGFMCHLSQTNSWFRDWIFGKNKEITKASEITTYSPCNYGLARTTVGEDVNKNDFLENITTYSEQARLEAEAEAKRIAEEQAAAEAAEQAKKETERESAEAEASHRRVMLALAITAACLTVLTVASYAARRVFEKRAEKKRSGK
ncbi:MAG: PIG-L family deacetylase [Clostridia bacterium]|nr:PIG-L family deacetylase [Clostridia bacterium]